MWHFWRHDQRGVLVAAALARFGIPLGRQQSLSTSCIASVDMLTTESRLMTGPTHPVKLLMTQLSPVIVDLDLQHPLRLSNIVNIIDSGFSLPTNGGAPSTPRSSPCSGYSSTVCTAIVPVRP